MIGRTLAAAFADVRLAGAATCGQCWAGQQVVDAQAGVARPAAATIIPPCIAMPALALSKQAPAIGQPTVQQCLQRGTLRWRTQNAALPLVRIMRILRSG